jgi:hypothetical protein
MARFRGLGRNPAPRRKVVKSERGRLGRWIYRSGHSLRWRSLTLSCGHVVTRETYTIPRTTYCEACERESR